MLSVNAPLFFVPQIESADVQEIVGDEAHHAIKVLRLKKNDQVQLSDGAGNWVIGEITDSGRKSFSVRILKRNQISLPKLEISIAQALVKSDRTKELFELLAQSNVNQIFPWLAEYSIGKWQPNSLEKWGVAVKEAAKQCHMYRLPKINSAVSTTDLINIFADFDQVIVLDQNADQRISQVFDKSSRSVLLVIGPEGGISQTEIQLFLSAKSKSVNSAKLSDLTFRSAHVAIAAVSSIQTLAGNW